MTIARTGIHRFRFRRIPCTCCLTAIVELTHFSWLSWMLVRSHLWNVLLPPPGCHKSSEKLSIKWLLTFKSFPFSHLFLWLYCLNCQCQWSCFYCSQLTIKQFVKFSGFFWLPVEFRCENLWKFHPTLSKTLKLSSEGCECAHNKPKTFLSAPNRIGLISRWLNIKCLEIWNVFFSFLLLANSQQQIVHKVLFLYLYSAEYKLFSALGLPFKVFVEVVIFIDLQWLQGLRQS